MNSTRPSRLLRLSRWQRFWRVDVPSGMIPLVWNGMMSFGGGWFFLTASEGVERQQPSVRAAGNRFTTWPLPVMTASSARCCIAIAVMDPDGRQGSMCCSGGRLPAWADRFRVEESEGAEALAASCSTSCGARASLGRLAKRFGKLVYPIDRASPCWGRRASAADVGNAPPGRRLGVRRPALVVAIGYGVTGV